MSSGSTSFSTIGIGGGGELTSRNTSLVASTHTNKKNYVDGMKNNDDSNDLENVELLSITIPSSSTKNTVLLPNHNHNVDHHHQMPSTIPSTSKTFFQTSSEPSISGSNSLFNSNNTNNATSSLLNNIQQEEDEKYHGLKESTKLLFFDLTHLPSYIQFILTASFLTFCFMVSGVTQESIFTTYKGFDYGFFLTLCQFAVYAFFGAINRRLSLANHHHSSGGSSNSFNHELSSTTTSSRSNNHMNGTATEFNSNTTPTTHSEVLTPLSPVSAHINNLEGDDDFDETYKSGGMTSSSSSLSLFTSSLKYSLPTYQNNTIVVNHIYQSPPPLKYYLMLSSFQVIGMGLGNESMAYLNYPTKILFKSSKLLVAMFVGVLLLKKRYKYLDYVASLFLIFGLLTLYGANQSVSNIKFESIGVILITCSLLFDSISSNLQEKILRELERSETELIYFAYMIGTFFLVFICAFTNQLIPPIAYCMEHPSILIMIFIYCFISYLGSVYVNKITKKYGILITLTITSTRKVLSIILSYIIFPKPIHFNHTIAIMLVFTGVFIRVYCKQKRAIDQYLNSFMNRVMQTFNLKNIGKTRLLFPFHAHNHSTQMDKSGTCEV
ncbi:hypothetical protein C9374_007364 [Naegleria lovaniensis]|uniref:Uncharacterized protein n=1 Tax=Naegleria lovaniensis TaxID=51637 RepID=A0AA88KH53_NAELO|nr:uncharacterized protein C9374_007364 [Naegleria lovaniensis]KAG2379225.1 hypothetical protein C9374_007364 [Naegleria lovaniensis]